MGESAKRHEENSNLIKEIRASTDAAIRNQGASIKTLEIQIGQMSKVLQERGFGSLLSSTETNLRDHFKSTSTIVEADASSICHKKGSYGPQFLEAYSYEASHIDKSIPRKEKDPGSFTLPCYINNVCFNNALANLRASISVMPLSTYLNLGLGELAHTKLTVELADRTVKYPKGIVENILVGIDKFVFPIDFIILDMPEDIKVALILGRPFLSTAHAKIDVFKRKITLRVGEEKIIFKSVKPTSSLIKRVYMLSLRERMELDLEARLMGETLVLNRSLDPFFGDYIELNGLNVPLELRRDQVDNLMPTIEEGGVVEEFRSRNDARMVSNFFGYPSDCDHDKKIRIDCGHNLNFKDMDTYRDEGMGDVIFGKLFLKEVGINEKRFKGMITIYNGNEEDTYQMVRSHPRFKRHIDEQCNKILPLLKVVHDKKFNQGTIYTFKDPEREFRLSRKHFKTLSQFLKELHDNTFSCSDHEDANGHIEKVLEIVDLFHIPNITIVQLMLRAFRMSLTRAASRWLKNKPSSSIATWEDLKTKFLSKYFPPARTANKMEEINNFQQEPDENLYQAWERFKELLMKSIQAQLNNLGREIKKVNEKVYAAQVGCEQCKGPHYTKDCSLKEEGKTLKEAYYTQFGAPFKEGDIK
ncbi:mitochondrial proton/calcium exchanger protein-like protein isoform X1 [Tanacetum coccineum]